MGTVRETTNDPGDGADPSVAEGTLSGTTVAGNSIVVIAIARQNAGGTNDLSVADDESNTYTRVADFGRGSGYARQIGVWVAEDITGGTSSCKVTVTAGAAVSGAMAMVAWEVDDVLASSIEDGAATSTYGTAVDSGDTATLSQADCMVLGAVGYFTTGFSTTGTYDTGPAEGTTLLGYSKEIDSTAAQAFEGTLSSAGSWAAAVVVIANDAAPASLPSQLLLLGVD
jgi:hypothetical protein